MGATLTLLILSQVYTWTDASGSQHFTDSLESIPRGVKVRTTEGAEISQIGRDQKKDEKKDEAVVVAKPTPVDESAREDLWRKRFRDARRRIEDLQADIESDRSKVEEVDGLPVSANLYCGGAFAGSGVLVTGFTVNNGVRQWNGVSFGSPCVFAANPEIQRLRERLAANRRELVRAQEDLQDLERRASFEAVPLHWRR